MAIQRENKQDVDEKKRPTRPVAQITSNKKFTTDRRCAGEIGAHQKKRGVLGNTIGHLSGGAPGRQKTGRGSKKFDARGLSGLMITKKRVGPKNSR